MIDWSRVQGFDWDSGNRLKNQEKHGVLPAEAEQVFLNVPLLVVHDREHSSIGVRFHALGVSDHGRRLHLTFTLRDADTRIRVMSARDMHRKERDIYEQGA